MIGSMPLWRPVIIVISRCHFYVRQSRDKPLRVARSLYRRNRPRYSYSLSEAFSQSTSRQSTYNSFTQPLISLITIPRKNRNNPEAGPSLLNLSSLKPSRVLTPTPGYRTKVS